MAVLAHAALTAALLVLAQAQNCPEEGVQYFADNSYCDRYAECREGVYSEQQCPDGLLFNDQVTNGRYPCDYPNDVDCTGRAQTQPAQPGPNCPNQWGIFSSGDASQCGFFFNCVAGRSYKFDCPAGLAFSSATYRCEYADESPDCDVQAYLGFTCPEPDLALFYTVGHAQFRSPRDCREFFLCAGRSPRLNYCDLGMVFNEATAGCDEPENVQGQCASYYPADELAAIREAKERRRLAEARLQEELEARRQELRARRQRLTAQ